MTELDQKGMLGALPTRWARTVTAVVGLALTFGWAGAALVVYDRRGFNLETIACAVLAAAGLVLALRAAFVRNGRP